MGTAVSPGHVIFLNGVSSSGKTSIAMELLAVLERPYVHMLADMFNGLRSEQRSSELSEAEMTAVTGAPGWPPPSSPPCTLTAGTTSNATPPPRAPATAMEAAQISRYLFRCLAKLGHAG